VKKTPTYIDNGYTMFFDDVSHEYTGVITKGSRSHIVPGTPYKIELMRNDTVVDTAFINDFDATTFNTRARQIYDDMVEYALSQGENHDTI
jgi:hypothetical protein